MSFVPETTLKCGYIYCGEKTVKLQAVTTICPGHRAGQTPRWSKSVTSALGIYSSLCFHTYSLLPNSVRKVARDYHSLSDCWEVSGHSEDTEHSVVGPGLDSPLSRLRFDASAFSGEDSFH